MSAAALAAVAAGGALGASARYLATNWGAAQFGTGFPWATLGINILGSALIGLLAGLGLGGAWRLFLVTGLLGGFTTFSAFSLDTLALWERAPLHAALYVASSVGFGIAACALSFLLARP